MGLQESFDVVIVGGGIEGLAIAWEVARRGQRSVAVLERDTLCSGGTGRTSGVVRCHYGVSTLAAMAWYGVQVLEDAPQRIGEDVGFRQVGYLVAVGADDVDALAANVKIQQSVGVDVALIDRGDAERLWPGADFSDAAGFAYEPRGGVGDGYLTGTAFGRAAARAGATIRQHTPVAGLVTDGQGRVVGVRTRDGATLAAETVVVAAGAWSVPLCAEVGVQLPIRAQHAELLRVSLGAATDTLPALSDLVSLQYFRPESSGEVVVGNSDHSRPHYVDPDRFPAQVSTEGLETAAAKLAHRLSGYPDATVAGGYTGFYDVTPDYNPMIGFSGVDGLFVCAGFSGHGFKIAPAVGRLVADLICDGASSDDKVDARALRATRFAEGEHLVSPHPYRGAGQMR